MVRKRNKIALIGAGQIGGTLGLLAGIQRVGDVVLYDVVPDMPQGKALDITHSAPLIGVDFEIKGTNDISDIAGADICVVTAGLPRKPGMSRDDLIETNAKIIGSVAAGIKEHAPNAMVIVITNPLDTMAYLMYRETGFDANRVVGMAGVLDAGRYRSLLAKELNVSVESVSAFVLGAHGDSMVPVRSYTTCNGIPVQELIALDRLDEIEAKVRSAGADIVALLKTGSAFYSTAAAAMSMVESYLFDRKKVVPASAYCSGEYGAEGVYIGVPIILGANGVEKVIEIELNDDESARLNSSVVAAKELVSKL